MTDAIENELRRGPGGGQVEAAVRGLLERASEERLIDVAYTTTDSPFGELLVATTRRGLVRLGFLGANDEEELVVAELAAKVSPRVLHAPARLDDVRRQLDEYFAGSRRKFDLRTDRVLIHGFARKVLSQTARIPYGSYLTYGEVAAEAGSPRAHRAAGSALARNPIPIVIPCHRVLRSGGVIGNYGGGPEMKAALLELEGAGVG